jgi:hypothetical protein
MPGVKSYTPEQLQRASVAVYLALEPAVADDLSGMLQQGATDRTARMELEILRDRLLDQLQTALETLRETQAELEAVRNFRKE